MSIYYDIPMAEYLSDPAISSSALKNILISPADYQAATLQKEKFETRYTLLGEAIHCAILEPDYLDERFAMQPEDWGPKNQNPGAQKWREFKIKHANKKILDFEDAQIVKRVAAKANYCEELTPFLDIGRPEVTAFAQVEGIKIKARTDLLFDDGTNVELLDVKTTTESLADNNIFNLIFRNGYHFQAAHHSSVFAICLGKPVNTYRWIFVSTSSPAAHIRIVRCPHDLMAWGLKDHKYAIKSLARCTNKDEWPGYETMVDHLEIPDWARRIYE